MSRILGITIVGFIASAAVAGTPTVDGTADGAYGAALAVQNTQTSFGDSNLGLVDWANGSELDQGFATIEGGVLYIVLSGNMESNFNKLELFIDCLPGGQNKLRGDNPDVDFNGLNRMGDDGSGNGLTFDAGFEADFWIGFTGGDGGGGVYSIFCNYAELLTSGGGTGYYLGSGGAVTDGTLIGGNNPNNILITINNSNVGGVTGGTGAGDGSGVVTGVEYAIPLAALGNPTGDIKMSAMVNGGGHDFLSNQVLAGIGGGDHLGEPRNTNLANIAGDQFFVLSQGGGCPGDIDGDGQTGQPDLGILLAAFNTCLGDPGFVPAADLNGDNCVGQPDLGILLADWACGT